MANALIEYAINENASLRFNVDNITDELYAQSTNWAVRRVFVGAPRSYLLTLQVRY